MKTFLVFFVLFAVACWAASDIVEKNGICVGEIKALESCLKKVQGKLNQR
jgi:ATP/ADP translocase